MRARGISLWGPPATQAVPATSATAYRDAVRFDLDWIVSGGIFESPIYSVLNSCRALRVLTGSADVFSKEEGAEWALTTFPPRFHTVVEQALRCYRSSVHITDAQRRTHGHDWDQQMLEQFRAFVADQMATR